MDKIDFHAIKLNQKNKDKLTEFITVPKEFEYQDEELICKIQTIEGLRIARTGDFIAKDKNNNFYVCKPEEFEKNSDEIMVIESW